MSLTPGTRLGAYEITGTLGAGGMGEVYRAHDARLARDVAIKILPQAVAGDPERMARFEREARLLASLQHPNIAAIYGLEEEAGQRFIVMECVEGATLAERIAPRGLPVQEALDVCRQIAAALEAAHEGGVIHRDLKPANVKITPAGEVKVLDFGLAKGGSVSAASDSNLSASPTMTYGATGVGVILGTAAYMSPEQARGKAVDRRTDIWSFGAVLFECLTGRQAFAGETLSDTIAKILQGEPEWNALPAKTPANVRNLLARCLERDAKKRLRDIGDARIELDEAIAGSNSTSRASGSRGAVTTDAKPSATRWLAIGTAAGLLLGIAGTEAVHRLGAGSSSGPLVRYPIELPDDLRMRTNDFTATGMWDVSEDGSMVAVLAQPRNEDAGRQTGPRAFVRRLAETDWKPVRGSDLAGGRIAFSADGHSVYFGALVSREAHDAQMMRASLDAEGPAVPQCDLPPDASACVLEDGRILVLNPSGNRFALVRPGATPAPDWKTIALGGYSGRLDVSSTTGAGIDRDRVFVGTTTYGDDGWHRGTALLDLGTGKLRLVLRDGQWALLLPDGHLIFTRGDAVFASRFDRSKLQPVGEAAALLQGVRTRGAWVPGRFQLTRRGDLVFASGGSVGERRDIVLFDLAGHPSPISLESRAYANIPTMTEDGRRVACVSTSARGIDEIWLLDAPDRVPQRAVSFPDADVDGPVLSPDGRWLAYTRRGAGMQNGIFVASLSGESEPHAVFRVGAALDSIFGALSWFPDGKHLVARAGLLGAPHLLVLDAHPGPGEPVKPRVLLPGYASNYARVSPNQRFLAFTSDRSGHDQVYVCSIAADGTTGEPVVVARGGFGADWSADGTRVFFGDSTFAKFVRVSTAGEISASPPAKLYDLGAFSARIDGASALADGRVIGVLRAKEDVEATRLEVIQNWLASVRTKLP